MWNYLETFVIDPSQYEHLFTLPVFQEFVLSEDYNKMTPARTYQGETVCGCVCLCAWWLSLMSFPCFGFVLCTYCMCVYPRVCVCVSVSVCQCVLRGRIRHLDVNPEPTLRSQNTLSEVLVRCFNSFRNSLCKHNERRYPSIKMITHRSVSVRIRYIYFWFPTCRTNPFFSSATRPLCLLKLSIPFEKTWKTVEPI